MIKNEVNIKDIMRDKWEVFISTFDGVFTKTTQFMLSSLELNLSTPMLKSFKNAFLDDVQHEHEYLRPLFLLFTIEDLKRWEKTHIDMVKNVNYLNDYNLGVDELGKDLIMYVFSVPEKFKMDYHNFRQGRYSHFSKAYKNKFSQYLSIKDKKEESIVWQVINKSEGLKRKLEEQFNLSPNELDSAAEIWDEVRKDREIYNYIKT